jgi:hypothetical protein
LFAKREEELSPIRAFSFYCANCHSFGEKTVDRVFENYPDLNSYSNAV